VAKPRWKEVSSLNVNVSAIYETNGQRRSFGSGEIIPKNAILHFKCAGGQGVPFPKNDYYVWWQVVNTCNEAGIASCMRGGFEKSDAHASRTEYSFYCGIHWVEAFLIRKRDRGLCGRSGRFFVVIDK